MTEQAPEIEGGVKKAVDDIISLLEARIDPKTPAKNLNLAVVAAVNTVLCRAVENTAPGDREAQADLHYTCFHQRLTGLGFQIAGVAEL